MKRVVTPCLLLLSLTLLSCNQENVIKGIQWGFEKMAGDGYLPSSELLALGEFERSEVNLSTQYLDGQKQGIVTLRLYNGKSESLYYSQENTARKCAEMYVNEYSKINDYQTIKILFIQTDPSNPENLAVSEYIFEVADFIEQI